MRAGLVLRKLVGRSLAHSGDGLGAKIPRKGYARYRLGGSGAQRILVVS